MLNTPILVFLLSTLVIPFTSPVANAFGNDYEFELRQKIKDLRLREDAVQKDLAQIEYEVKSLQDQYARKEWELKELKEERRKQENELFRESRERLIF